MNLKHIYWFAYFNISEPSVRYRAKYVLQELKAQRGVTYTFVYPGYTLKNIVGFVFRYLSVLIFRRKDSLIVFQKIYTRGLYANLLKLLLVLRPRYTLYDIDDAEYLRRSDASINFFIKNCASCSVGSSALMDYAEKLNPQVLLLTSPVISHGFIKKPGDGPFTIGWIGYYNGHRDNLHQLIFPALKQLPFKTRFLLLGVVTVDHANEIRQYFKDVPNVEVELPCCINWLDEAAVYEQVSRFDVGLAPLLNSEFNRAKSAFKLKQCLSCGVPVLASPVGENLTFIKEGSNGFFCEDSEDYYAHIMRIFNLPESDYWQMSRQAYESRNSFTLFAYYEQLLHYYYRN